MPSRNEKGELLNEEGLPIVDIVEPVPETTSASASSPTHIFDDPDLLPPWALSPGEKARRRAERERILDLLEEEERVQQERDEALERERWREGLEKRKEAAKAELDGLRKARELQKRMGKALIRNVTEAREREEKDRAAKEEEEREESEGRKKSKSKSVSFAGLPAEGRNEEEETTTGSGWGDVTLARLQRKGKTTLMTRAQMDKQPMKMKVVERHPSGLREAQQPGPAVSEGKDSDDESVPGSPVPPDSDEDDIIHSERPDDDSDLDSPPNSPSPSDESDLERLDEEDEPVEWQDGDLDFVRHQREIALAYYERRSVIGSEVSSAMRAHTHDDTENEWDQPEVPLDATLASPPPKPSISRFKAERSSSSNAPSSTLASHSLGPSVLPSSQSSSLNSAIRMGKLEGGKLVGGESDDEGNREAREILEMLARGEVTNVGPHPASTSGKAGMNTVVSGPSASGPAVSSFHPALQQTSNSLVDGTDVVAKPKLSKVSKFKLALAQANEKQDFGLCSPDVPPDTPRSVAERSSPKRVSPALGIPIVLPSPSSRTPARAPNPALKRASANSSPPIAYSETQLSLQIQMPSMVVESPSFRPPALAATNTPSAPRSPSTDPASSAVIDSPSFLQPASASTVVGSPTFSSSVIDSPSFQNATSPVSIQSPAIAPVTEARPPVIVAAEVKESAPGRGRNGASPGGRQRVSRFLAERM
ncbi:hypothetical protein AcW2_004958 [Taiwanofungus camphoratus]|nr:hypothetical protein AcW2_004958 [Antrodia cinnamomea]